MKKWLSLLMVCTLALSSVGCSSKPADGSAGTEKAADTTAAGTSAAAADAGEKQNGNDGGSEAALPSGSITWLTNSAYGDVPQKMADVYKRQLTTPSKEFRSINAGITPCRDTQNPAA